MNLFFLVAVLCCTMAGPGLANSIAGQASVIDGDTIEIHGERIRLVSIDAPESRQPCFDRQGRAWRCGQQAALALSDFIARRPVTCRSQGKDRYHRILGDCAVANVSLSGWMVENGWAVPYYDRDGSHTMGADRAKIARRGIWAGTFELPKDWRRGN
ncbi:thermonuclease family protein [Stutzerimonas stutzeri]|nr:thermonuclease family protein [Stutzerimonas stutzeri]